MVRDVDLVEDIAQETFIRAYRALGQFRGEAQFYTWLYRIAVNTAKKALVDLKRDPLVSESALRGGEDEDETSSVENELTSAETPETVLAAKEIAARVNSAMPRQPVDKLWTKFTLWPCNEPLRAAPRVDAPGFLPTMKLQLSQLP